MELLDTTATVQTPERVSFRYRLAGPGQRAVAWTVDVVLQLVLVVMLVMGALLFGLATGWTGVGFGAILFGMFCVQWFYGVAWDWCFCLMPHGKPIAWVGCLTDTD